VTAFVSRWSVLFGAALALVGSLAGPARAAYQLPAPTGVRTSFTDDLDFLDYVQRNTFNYFWATQNPTTGLMLDRASNPGLCSIASLGFGLSSINVAVDRGWITRAQARARVRTTLQFLWGLPQGAGTTGVAGYHGWFYHFLDTTTGLRVGTSELSTIDTTLLMLGVLDCGLYYDDPVDPDEAAIRQASANLIGRLDWNFVKLADNRIAMAWDPSAGYQYGGWSGYSEAMALYLLGIGAATNPLPGASWTAWTSTYLWKTHFGYSYVWTPTGSLFTHCYSHCWVDFRGINDPYLRTTTGGVDYFENSRRALLAQQAYAATQPFPNYSSSEFGVTACDGPNATVGGVYYAGYEGRGAPPGPPTTIDDGTLAPTGSLGCLPFDPEVGIAVARHLYDTYQPRIWSGYGFCDSFNLKAGEWFDPDVVGIDAGPIILMIENYRSGSVWRRVLHSPVIQRGLQRAGFTAPPPESVAAGATLGSQLEVTWVPCSSFETGFQVEISTDNQNFTTAATTPAGSAHASLSVSPGTTYYVRVRTTSSAGLSGVRGVAVATTPIPAAITAQPASRTVRAGQAASFTVAADGSPTPALAWQRKPLGGSFVNLGDGGAYAGTTTATLTIAGTTTAMSGDQFRCLATNSAGSATSAAATLTVQVAAGDFNGDGRADLLWQNTATGEHLVWLMNGTTYQADLELGAAPVDWAIFATADFNADGQPDLLWRNTVTGECLIWLLNGSAYASTVSLGVIPVSWQIAGTGDFNADGQPDIVWQNSLTGERVVWLMNGPTFQSGVSLGIVPPVWAIAGVADFNADGDPDLLWTNTRTGELSIWLMSGSTYLSSASPGVAPVDWQVAGVGDYNGDGQPDILWTNTFTGQRAVWLLNGTAYAGRISLGTVPAEWVLGRPLLRRVPADLNGDGNSDLVWQNTATGERVVWLMNGTTYLSSVSLGAIPTDWSIVGLGDFNADGHPDIVWQNAATGECVLWFMDGATYLSSASLGVVPIAWSVAGVGDFNGDGSPDILWQNTATGERALWFMDGAAVASSGSFGVVSSDWSIATVADFNGDGWPDILWQNTVTGERVIWLLQGPVYVASVSLGVIPMEWVVAGTGEFGADGSADIVWQNTATGERVIWLMDGTTFLSGVSLGVVPVQWAIRN